MHQANRVSGIWVLVITAALALVGCRETPKPPSEQPAPRTAPAVPPTAEQPIAPPAEAAPSTQPAAPPSSQPAATRPAVRKPSKTSYEEDRPPYSVDTTITALDDPQAGWLHVEALADEKQSATVHGQFPEANRMEVETTNVAGLSIDLSMLPIKPKRSIILWIDRQGIELSQRHRGRILLSRSSTGHWTVLTPVPR